MYYIPYGHKLRYLTEKPQFTHNMQFKGHFDIIANMIYMSYDLEWETNFRKCTFNNSCLNFVSPKLNFARLDLYGLLCLMYIIIKNIKTCSLV